MKWWPAVLVVLASGLAWADEPAKPNQLTPKEITDGWISLFDGETTFGWKIDGEAKVENGTLVVGEKNRSEARFDTPFYSLELVLELKRTGDSAGLMLDIADTKSLANIATEEWERYQVIHRPMADKSVHTVTSVERDGKWKRLGANQIPIPEDRVQSVIVLAGPKSQAILRNIKLRPLGYKPIFNGKDLTGWKEFPGKKSKWSVSKEGWIHLEDGPGDLQTEDQWADFILSAECISNGPHCNSGIFFRCIPGQYQQGYEAQIRNEWKDEDRTKPIDYGTGAIYRRQAARKVVSSDHEWFTMTIAAHGNHLATWVNGYQVTDFTDTRPANDNARNGSKTGKGAISLQGHDPTTNLDFRNIRIVDLPVQMK